MVETAVRIFIFLFTLSLYFVIDFIQQILPCLDSPSFRAHLIAQNIAAVQQLNIDQKRMFKEGKYKSDFR